MLFVYWACNYHKYNLISDCAVAPRPKGMVPLRQFVARSLACGHEKGEIMVKMWCSRSIVVYLLP